MATLTEREIEKAKGEFHDGRIDAVELVNQVMSAGREESERHRLLEQVRQVLGERRPPARLIAK